MSSRPVVSARRAVVAATFLAFLPAWAHAQAPLDSVAAPAGRPVQVALTAGTLGIGAQVSRLVTDRVALRVGASAFGLLIDDVTREGFTADANLRLVTAQALVDLYPFRTAPLHLTVGAVTGTTRALVRARPEAGTFTINDQEYPAGAVGRLDGDLTVPRTMPYAGIGFGRPRRHGLALVPFADIGVAFGKPTVTLRAENAARNPQLAADVEAQRRRLQDDLGRFPVVPVITWVAGWRF
ncbi:MAG: hypothetical protein ACXW05_06705 [Gemmatirosa sp.]